MTAIDVLLIILGMLVVAIATSFSGVAIKKAGIAWRIRAEREPGQPHYAMYLFLAGFGMWSGLFTFYLIGETLL